MHNEKGVTFIEIMISALILSISIGGMLTTFVMGRVSVAKAKHRIEAFNLIQEKMEIIRDTSYSSIVTELPASVTIDNAGTTATTDDLIGQRSVNVNEVVASGYKEVTVTIIWTEHKWGGSNQVSENVVTVVSQ